jgi:hypothetical protein
MPPTIPWTDIVNSMCNIVLALAAFIATIAGIKGFNRWRNELKGKAQFDVARELGKLALQFKYEYHYSRSPFVSSGEYADRPVANRESDEVKNENDCYYARMRRLEMLRKTVYQLQLYSWEGKVFFTPKIQDIVGEMVHLYGNLWADVKVSHDCFLAHCENVLPPEKIYGMDDDERGKIAETIIQNMLDQLQPYLKIAK